MSIRHIDSHARRAKRLLLPDTLIGAARALGFGNSNIGFPNFFRLRRCKGGTVVQFIWKRGPIGGGELTVDASHQFGHWPADFDAARKWVAEVATRMGFEVSERKAVRAPRFTEIEPERTRCGNCLLGIGARLPQA